MSDPRSTRRFMLARVPLAAALVGALVAGCAGETRTVDAERLTAADFRAPQSARGSGAEGDAQEPADTRPRDPNATGEPLGDPDRVLTREQAGGGEDVTVLTGSPATFRPDASNPLGASDEAAAERLAAAEPRSPRTSGPPRVLVDQLVGQINGRPIFASEFFEPMDARLAAEAKRLRGEPEGRVRWVRDAAERIAEEMQNMLRDELYLAELEASLTPQEKQGLVAFVRRIREELISQSRGSETLANRKTQQSEGRSLDEVVRAERDRELIGMQLQREVASKVYVAWRDVQQEYNRRYDEFNPPAKAVLRMMWIPGDDEARLEEARRRLEAGDAFAEIASDLSDFRRSEGGLLDPITIDEAGYEQTRLLGPDALNDAAQGLEEGEVAGPIDYLDKRAWLRLEEIREDRRSLYDVQLELFRELQVQQAMEEEQKYFRELLERANVTDVRLMQERLLLYAVDRYWTFSD